MPENYHHRQRGLIFGMNGTSAFLDISFISFIPNIRQQAQCLSQRLEENDMPESLFIRYHQGAKKKLYLE
jgi:hypothetical protein